MPLPPPEHSILKSLHPSARKIVVAVSGGVDSVVLLHLLKNISASRQLTLEVAHLDHQLRVESAADAVFVEQLSRRLDLPIHLERYDVSAVARAQGISLEMAARQARRDFLRRVVAHTGADLVALGHHRDDQAETLLLRLTRGSGISGLAAMAVLRDIWWRPLLGFSRWQIELYASKRQLDWVEDRTNRDTDIARNCLRHQVMPMLRQLNPKVEVRIAELAGQIQLEEDFWQEQVDRAWLMIIADDGDGELVLKREALASLHPALRLRVLRQALQRVRNDLQGIEARHLRAIDGLVTGTRSQAQLDLPRCWVARRYDLFWLRICPPDAIESFEYSVTIPGRTPLPDGRMLVATMEKSAGGESQHCVEFDLAQLKEPLRVRSWRPGDRFAPAGMTGRKRLKRYFADAKVTLEERAKTPLLVAGEQVLWVVGMRRSCHARTESDTVTIVRLCVEKKADN